MRKDLSLAYSAFAAFLNACEKTTLKPRRRIAYSKTILTGVEPRAKKKHLGRAILAAETWEERDKLLRRLAAQCYETVRWFKQNGDYKQAAKWMNLVLRFLRLSMDPKAREDVDRVEKELAALKTQMHELEGKQGEQDNGEDAAEG